MIPPSKQRDAELAALAVDTEGVDAGFWRNNNNSGSSGTNANASSEDGVSDMYFSVLMCLFAIS